MACGTAYGRRISTVTCGMLALGIGSTANAQSSVTLYGVLDAGIVYATKAVGEGGGNAGHLLAFNDSGTWASGFGMTGVEDLGSGLKVIFKIESGFSIANGAITNSNGNAYGRNTWVGLESNYGTVKAGVQYSPFVESVATSDARGGASYSFGSDMVQYVGNVVVTGFFNANSLSYESPKIAGLSGSAMMALGGTAGNFAAGRQYSVRLTYDIASLHLDAATYNGNAGGTAASTPFPSTVVFAGRALAASYYIDSLTLHLAYALYKVAGAFSSQVYSGGFSFFVTPYLNLNAGVYCTRDGNDSSSHSILAVAGVEYLFSKRTGFYAEAGVVSNHGKMNTGFIPGVPEVTGTSAAFNVGIRHTF